MNYFTPDLIDRFGSPEPAVADEADAAWEEAGNRYRAYLASVKAQLPPGLRQVLNDYYLHDAVVLAMGRLDGRVVVVLQLDTPPQDLLILTYDLLGAPEVLRDVLPDGHRCPTRVEWMYDEVERVPGEPAGWVQSVLFGNGWELRLRFRDVHVQRLQPVLPAAAASLLQSA
jgi:hypothetical protein